MNLITRDDKIRLTIRRRFGFYIGTFTGFGIMDVFPSKSYWARTEFRAFQRARRGGIKYIGEHARSWDSEITWS